MPDKLKVCNDCGEAKPLDAFNKQKRCRDGRRPQCKACKSAQMKRIRDADLEKYRAKDRARHWNHPGRRESVIAAARAHYERNPERARAERRAYYEANPEVFEKSRAKRNALVREVEHKPYSRRDIYDRDGGECRGCKRKLPYEKGAFQIDHIVPISLGGPDIPANVQLMCPKCNRAKWAKLDGQIHMPV